MNHQVFAIFLPYKIISASHKHTFHPAGLSTVSPVRNKSFTIYGTKVSQNMKQKFHKI